MTAIIMKGVGYEDRQEIELPESLQGESIKFNQSTSLHPALKIKGVPTPRPDLLVIRMSDDDQVSKTSLDLLPGTTNQENWRRTVGVVVKLGALVNSKSAFSVYERPDDYVSMPGEAEDLRKNRRLERITHHGLREGDKVLIATASGDVYMVKNEYTNTEVQHRIISPTHIIAVLED